MKIYFAGPLFSAAEKKYNRRLCGKLEANGFEVFLPQRDGVEKSKLLFGQMSKDERRKAMFEMDRDRIIAADVFLFVLDGRVPDEGACVELGIAYAQRYFRKTKKYLIGLQTDIRAAFLGGKLNPMIKVPLDYLVTNEAELIAILKKLSESHD